ECETENAHVDTSEMSYEGSVTRVTSAEFASRPIRRTLRPIRAARLPRFELDDVARKQQVERPVDGDANSSIERRQPQQVIRSPDPPRREARYLQTAEHRDGLPLAEIRHLSLHLIVERAQRLAVD